MVEDTIENAIPAGTDCCGRPEFAVNGEQLHVNPNRPTKVLHRAPGATEWDVWDLERAINRVAELMKNPLRDWLRGLRLRPGARILPGGDQAVSRQGRHRPAGLTPIGSTDRWPTTCNDGARSARG
jgi:hypothetical protein